MGLIRALGNLVRGWSNQAEEAMADPVRDGKFAIEDAQKQVETFKGRIADLMAGTASLKRQRDEAQKAADKFDALAKKAAAVQNVDDVRAAVTEKNKAQEKVNFLNTQIGQNETLEQQLREQLAEALDLIAHSEDELTNLAAREEANNIRGQLIEAASEFTSGKGGLASLKDLEKKVVSRQDVLAAKEQLLADSPVGKAKELEKKYGTFSADLEADVASYMAAAAPPQKATGGRK